jgi:hypothetical protein
MFRKITIALTVGAVLTGLAACSTPAPPSVSPTSRVGQYIYGSGAASSPTAASTPTQPDAAPTQAPPFKVSCKMLTEQVPGYNPAFLAQIEVTNVGSYQWQLPGDETGDLSATAYLQFDVKYLSSSGSQVAEDQAWEPDNTPNDGVTLAPGQSSVFKDVYDDMSNDSDETGQGVTSCEASIDAASLVPISGANDG